MAPDEKEKDIEDVIDDQDSVLDDDLSDGELTTLLADEEGSEEDLSEEQSQEQLPDDFDAEVEGVTDTNDLTEEEEVNEQEDIGEDELNDIEEETIVSLEIQQKYVLNLASEVSDQLMEIIQSENIRLVSSSEEVPAGEEVSLILIGDEVQSLDEIAETCQTVSRNIPIITLYDVKDKLKFFNANGRGSINQRMLQLKVVQNIVKRLFTSNSSLILEEIYGELLDNFKSLKVTGHLGVGYYADVVAKDAFQKDFNIVSIRNYFIGLITYLSYLNHAKISEFPIEIDYGEHSEAFVVQVHAPVVNFVTEYIWESLLEEDGKNPFRGLLKTCLRHCDLFDIYYLENSSKIVMTGVWSKAEIEKSNYFSSMLINNIEAFEHIKTRAKAYDSSMAILPEGPSDDDVKQMEKKELPGESVDLMIAELSSLMDNPELLKKIVNFLMNVRKEEENPIDADELKIIDIDNYLTEYPEQEEIENLNDTDKRLIIDCLRDSESRLVDTVVGAIESATEEEPTVVSGQEEEEESKQVISGGEEEEEESVVVKGSDEEEEEEERIFGKDKEDEEDKKTVFKSDGPQKKDDDVFVFSQVTEKIDTNKPLKVLKDNEKEKLLQELKKSKGDKAQSGEIGKKINQFLSEQSELADEQVKQVVPDLMKDATAESVDKAVHEKLLQLNRSLAESEDKRKKAEEMVLQAKLQIEELQKKAQQAIDKAKNREEELQKAIIDINNKKSKITQGASKSLELAKSKEDSALKAAENAEDQVTVISKTIEENGTQEQGADDNKDQELQMAWDEAKKAHEMSKQAWVKAAERRKEAERVAKKAIADAEHAANKAISDLETKKEEADVEAKRAILAAEAKRKESEALIGSKLEDSERELTKSEIEWHKEKTSLEHDIREKDEEIRRLRDMNAKVTVELETLKETQKVLEDTKLDNTKDGQGFKEALKNLNVQLVDANRKLQGKELAIQRMNEVNLQLQNNHKKVVNNLEEQIENYKNRTTDRDARKLAEQEELLLLRGDNRSLKGQIEILNKKLSFMTSSMNRIKEKSAEKSSEQLQKLRESKNEMSNEITRYKNDNDRLSRHIRAIQEDLDRAQKNYLAAKQKLDNQKEVKTEDTSSYVKKIREQTETIKKLQEQERNNKQELQQAELAYRQLEYKMKNLAGQLQKSQSKQKSELASQAGVRELELKLKQTELMNEKLTEAAAKLKGELDERKKELLKVKSENTALNHKITELERKVARKSAA